VARLGRFVLCGHPASIPDALRARLKRMDRVLWLPVLAAAKWPARRPSAASGWMAGASVRVAAGLALQGQAQALVTAPLSKEALKLAGERHPGHTELLAELAGLQPDEVGMLLAGGGLRVFLVTRHQSLRSAITGLTPGAIVAAARLAGRGIAEAFGIRRPRLALAALNPHAGEAGAFGDEERRVLAPALKRLARERGFSVKGPLPADTVFVQAVRGAFDAVLCLYHDQGLIPLKLLAFDSGVNVSIGLPIIRTSVDHGTAFDIAGRGVARPDSLLAAIQVAVQMVNARNAGQL